MALALSDSYTPPGLDVPSPRERPRFSVYDGIGWKRQLPPDMVDSPEGFLAYFPHLLQLVEEAKVRLLDAFGSSTDVVLRLLREPDEGSTPELMVVACTLLEPDAALAAMERLEDGWWFDQLERSDGRVHLAFQHKAE